VKTIKSHITLHVKQTVNLIKENDMRGKVAKTLRKKAKLLVAEYGGEWKNVYNQAKRVYNKQKRGLM